MTRFFLVVLTILAFNNALAYNINSGDVIHLEVFGEPELALDVTVDTLGFITYPFVGKLSVVDKSVESVKTDVIAHLKDGYFINPQVTVFVKSFQPFFIQGEVATPGSYSFEIGMTVRKAIALAGGLTERASSRKIYLVRAGDNDKNEVKVGMDEKIFSGDIIQIKESFF